MLSMPPFKGEIPRNLRLDRKLAVSGGEIAKDG